MATNTLNAYNPIFYASETIKELEFALGMASRVNRRLEAEKGREPGDQIQIKVPATFEAQDVVPGVGSTSQDLNTKKVTINLDNHKEVKYEITDRELAYTTEQIISDHIRPAAYAIARAIDKSLALLYKKIPYYTDWSSPAAVADITAARTILFNNGVPVDNSADMHFMVDGTIEGELLNLQAFSQFQGAGPEGVNTQRSGLLGPKFGFNFFANQNVQSHTSGTSADADGAINNVSGYEAGALEIDIDGFTSTGTVKVGDILLITGHTKQYTVQEDQTASGGAFTGLSIFPGLEDDVVDGQVVTLILGGAAKSQSLAFHRDFGTLVMVPLTELGNGRGAEIFTTVDPVTRLSVRARAFYDGNTQKNYMAIDALWGVEVLEERRAVRVRN